jgi:hypothetical protein
MDEATAGPGSGPTRCRGPRPRPANHLIEASGCGLGRKATGPLLDMSSKSERRTVREEVATNHGIQLAVLISRVGEAIDRHRAGELDAFDVDHVLHHYSRAAKELWKFCNMLQVEIAADIIRSEPPIDWWQRGAPKER